MGKGQASTQASSTWNTGVSIDATKPKAAHTDHHALLEESPAYTILKEEGMLTTDYRLENASQIDCRASNTSIGRNYRMKAAYGTALPVVGLVAHQMVVREFEVPKGHIRCLEDGRGNFEFAGPGLHRIFDPWYRVQRHNKTVTHGVIEHGDRTIAVVEQGHIGLAMDQGQPILLPPGLHQWQSPTLRFQKSIDLSDHIIRFSPYTLLTVDEGYSAVTQDNGRQVVLPGGRVHLLRHKNHKFEKFVSQKIQTNMLEDLLVTSADNVLMKVTSTVVWRITDVETAARMAAETMHPDGKAIGGQGEDIKKLRYNVLKQAEASLSSFVGTLNYSDTFSITAGVAATGTAVGVPLPAQGTGSGAPAASGNLLFDTTRLQTAVHHANELTIQYGVKIMSINIITAMPADNNLMISLAKGAVAAAEAQQAETAARGKAIALRIQAEGQAEADKIRAEGAKAAAELIETSEVAVQLAKIEKTGLAIGNKSTFFFGTDPATVGNLLANSGIVSVEGTAQAPAGAAKRPTPANAPAANGANRR